MKQNLNNTELETISAWMDGELDPDESRQVECRVQEDPDWAEAYRQFQMVDTALDCMETPSVPDALKSKIVASASLRSRSDVLRKILTAVSVAAVIAISVSIYLHMGNPPEENTGTTAVQVVDEFASQGLPLFLEGAVTDDLPLETRIYIETGGSLADTIENKDSGAWAKLDEQLKTYARKQARAFLDIDSEQYQELIERHKTANDSSNREIWIVRVAQSLSPAEKKRLKKLSLTERARFFMQRKQEMLQEEQKK